MEEHTTAVSDIPSRPTEEVNKTTIIHISIAYAPVISNSYLSGNFLLVYIPSTFNQFFKQLPDMPSKV